MEPQAWVQEHISDGRGVAVTIFIAHCSDEQHGHLVLNSGHHYRERFYAEIEIERHLIEDHAIMPDGWVLAETLHEDCSYCRHEAFGAIATAGATGSRGARQERMKGWPDIDEVAHSARVERVANAKAGA